MHMFSVCFDEGAQANLKGINSFDPEKKVFYHKSK